MRFLRRIVNLFRRRRDDGPVFGVVVLLRGPSGLNESRFRALVAQATGLHIGQEPDPAGSFVVGEPPHYMMKLGNYLFSSLHFDEPYGPKDDDTLANLPDLRQQKAIKEHNAWVSVDLIGPPHEQELTQAERFIGRIAAAIIESQGDNALAVYSPHLEDLCVINDDVIAQLRSIDPMSVFDGEGPVPVVNVDHDDPRMQAAVEEAHRRFPEFISAFESRSDNQSFAIKAPITVGEETEFIWIDVRRIESDGTIHGVLGNDPLDLGDMKRGAPVTVPRDDLSDWIYIIDEEVHGGFTLPLFFNEDEPASG